MKLGIMSDNHGRLQPVQIALEMFQERGVECVAHCGDLGGLETLELLAGWKFWFVWGNTDCPDPTWRPIVQSLGATWPEKVPVMIDAGESRIAVYHGHEPGFRRIRGLSDCTYVLHGHTHEPSDRREGPLRVINPGALHRASPKTVAMLDTELDELEFLTVRG